MLVVILLLEGSVGIDFMMSEFVVCIGVECMMLICNFEVMRCDGLVWVMVGVDVWCKCIELIVKGCVVL